MGYLFLALVSVYCLTPIYWLALAATKNNTDLFSSFGLWLADFNLVANLQDLDLVQVLTAARGSRPATVGGAVASLPAGRNQTTTSAGSEQLAYTGGGG